MFAFFINKKKNRKIYVQKDTMKSVKNLLVQQEADKKKEIKFYPACLCFLK